ncbi:MAG TPA: hypothetical protein VJH63_00515 [Candidatus Paceibacterota bacterium]
MKKFLSVVKKLNFYLNEKADQFASDYARKPFILCLIFLANTAGVVGSIGILIFTFFSFIFPDFGDEWYLRSTSVTLTPVWIFVFWNGVHSVRHSSWHLIERLTKA